MLFQMIDYFLSYWSERKMSGCQVLVFVDDCRNRNVETAFRKLPLQERIYVKDYADAKFGCVPVAQPKICHYRPRELPGRGTYLQSFSYTPPCTVVASFRLRHRDTPQFSLCVIAATDAGKWSTLKATRGDPRSSFYQVY